VASPPLERRDREFADVFATHRDHMVRLAWLLTSDVHVAEDVVADAFAKVHPRWRRGQVDDVAAYLRRSVVNGANSALRRRYTQRAHERRVTGDDRGIRLLDDEVADRDQVIAALRQLPDRQRAAVVLRFWADCTEAQAADALGVSIGTVKSNTARGMHRLREVLGVEQEGVAR